jgi:hypothetical protein
MCMKGKKIQSFGFSFIGILHIIISVIRIIPPPYSMKASASEDHVVK